MHIKVYIIEKLNIENLLIFKIYIYWCDSCRI